MMNRSLKNTSLCLLSMPTPINSRHLMLLPTQNRCRSLSLLLPIFLLLTFFPFTAPASASDQSGFEFGFQHRARFVDFDDIIDYTDAIDDHNRFYRFRTRLWGRLIHENIEVKLQLANEFRHYDHPDRDHTYDEIFVDECYLKADGLFGSAWSLAIGRQNIMKADGMILFDASPLDGSRSTYFNSVIIRRSFGLAALDIIGISNPASDQYFPRINDQARLLVENDEQAIGAYMMYRSTSNAGFDAAYFYKEETSPHHPSSTQFQPDRNLHIGSVRGTMPTGSSGTIHAEFGLELGRRDPDQTIAAWAGHAAWKHRLDITGKPQFQISAAALSGDDPDTADDEGWTPPFSRWPQWSELYIYSFIREQGVAAWSNLWFVNAGCVITPVDAVTVRIAWYRMNALYAPAQTTSVFGTGTNRGDLFQIRADLKLARGLTGHVLYEHHIPGNFYADDAAGHFLRFELQYQFAHFFKTR